MNMQMSELMMSITSLLAIYFVHKILKKYFAQTCDKIHVYQDILELT